MTGRMRKMEEKQKTWEEELCSRLGQLSEGDDGIKHMTRKDYIVAAAITAFCLCAVVLGALL